MTVTSHLKRSTRKHRASHSQTLPYSILLRVRFTLPTLSPESRWALTPPFHHCLCPLAGSSAVCFLWHFLSDHSAWALPSTLLCGARTFLRHLNFAAGDYPVYFSPSNATNNLPLLKKFVKRKAKKWEPPQFSGTFRLTEANTNI